MEWEGIKREQKRAIFKKNRGKTSAFLCIASPATPFVVWPVKPLAYVNIDAGKNGRKEAYIGDLLRPKNTNKRWAVSAPHCKGFGRTLLAFLRSESSVTNPSGQFSNSRSVFARLLSALRRAVTSSGIRCANSAALVIPSYCANLRLSIRMHS